MAELKVHGFDANSINEVREATGLLLHSMYVGGNKLIMHRINHIHMIITMPEVAYNAAFAVPINQEERAAFIAVVIDRINEGDYDIAMVSSDTQVLDCISNEILSRDAPAPVRFKIGQLTVTIEVGDQSHTFKKNELFVRDSIALKHVLDTFGIKHAILP